MAINKIVTLDDVKQYYDITGSKPEDELFFEKLILQIQKLFENYIGVDSLFNTTYTEYVDGTGSKYLFLQNTPINSVTSIHEDSSWIWEADSLVDVDDYLVVNHRYIVSSTGWSLGDQNFKVVYTAGHIIIPEDLKLAAVEEIIKRFKNRDVFDLVSRNLPDGSVSYVEKGMLKSTREILNQYKVMRAF